MGVASVVIEQLLAAEIDLDLRVIAGRAGLDRTISAPRIQKPGLALTGWDEQLHGAHSGNAMFNARGIGICLIGNFEQAPPTKEQMQSVRTLVAVLATRHQIPRERIIGHAAVKATACPGKHFPLNELRQVIPETRR